MSLALSSWTADWASSRAMVRSAFELDEDPGRVVMNSEEEEGSWSLALLMVECETDPVRRRTDVLEGWKAGSW